jgi:hypothetical protein
LVTEPQNDSLDQYVDYIRNVVIVILAAVGAYWTIVTKEEILLPWAIFLIFGATVYALFLPYKRAALITDDWKSVGRLKALGLVFLGIPFYLVPAFLMLISSSYTDVLPLAQSYFANCQVLEAFLTIVGVIPPFLMGGIFGGVFANFPLLYLLSKTGYNRDEIQDVKKYGADRSLVLGLGFAEIIFVALLYLSAGWVHPESIEIYTLGTVAMIILLIFFGHFYVRCFASALNQIHRRILEILFVILIILSAFSIYMTAICGLIACVVLAYFYYLSEKNLHKLGTPSEFMMMNKKKVEEREMNHHIIGFTFYKLHPKTSFIVAFLMILWFVVFVFTVPITIEMLVFGLVVVYFIQWIVPRIWLRVNS